MANTHKTHTNQQLNLKYGRDRELEAMADALLWNALEDENNRRTQTIGDRSPQSAEKITKKNWATTFGLNYRWNSPPVVSLEGLLEMTDENSQFSTPTLHTLGSCPSPPTSRRHATPEDLVERSRDREMSKEIIERRAKLYQDLNGDHSQSADKANIRRQIKDLSSALYDLCGDTPIPNADPLTWDTSFYEKIPLDLVVAPIAATIDLEWDPTLGIYTSSYNFCELCAAIATDELVEWWDTRDEKVQKQILRSYWSYVREISVAAQEHRLVDLRDANQIDRMLNQLEAMRETPIWDMLEVGAKRSLNPIQWTVFEMKLNGRQNRDIRQEVNSTYGTSYRENYISTIWHKQISSAIANFFVELELEIQSLAEPELWKRCKSCGKLKLANTTNFVKRKQCGDGLAGVCKECEKKRRDEKKEIIEFNKRGSV